MSERTISYGDGDDRYGILHVPDTPGAQDAHSCVVLIHGGFWRARYDMGLMAPLARDLATRGMAVWRIEYARVGGSGGFPATFADVAAAIDHLAELAPVHGLDPGRVRVVGHSAGGHLALWAAGRRLLPRGAPGSAPRVQPAGVVGQAAVADLRAADADALGDGAVRELLGGGPDQAPDAWRVADPMALVGHGVPTLLIHGHGDVEVPARLSEAYAAAAIRAGDPVELAVLPGGHYEHLEPASRAWARVVAWLWAVDPHADAHTPRSVPSDGVRRLSGGA